MKTIQLFIAIFLTANALQAQDQGLYWKYKDYDGAIAVSVPRWATFVGSAFIEEKADRQLVRKIRRARVLFFEDESSFSQRDLKKFVRKSKRRGLDELVTVRSGKTHVRVLAKSHQSNIKKVVVLFSSPEGAGLVTVKGKFRLDEINRAIEKSSKEGKKKDGDILIPKLPNVPVIRA
ncbi:MAG: DUF4252 domain-containing protein [Saprospiraceae bacterium]|nr:DUF4252 domain-containing protein [Saprospiraceae bacterium]